MVWLKFKTTLKTEYLALNITSINLLLFFVNKQSLFGTRIVCNLVVDVHVTSRHEGLSLIPSAREKAYLD